MRPVVCIGLLLPALASCVTQQGARAGRPGRHRADRVALANRAEELWAATEAQDWGAVFDLKDPREHRGGTKEDFIEWSTKEEPFRVLSYDIRDVQMDGDLGWVQVRYRALVNKFPDVPARDAETWQRWHCISGTWFPVPIRDLAAYPEPPVMRDALEEARLRARFAESWEARLAKDWHRLYEFSDPLDRADVGEQEFVDAEGSFEYFSHKVHWVEVIKGQGRVRVSYEHRVMDPSLTKLPAMTVGVTETWVRRDGQWFRDLKPE